MQTKLTAVLRMIASLTALSAFLASTLMYAQRPAGSARRPPGVPENYVVTPFGYANPSCVEQLAEGDALIADGRYVQHADGALKYIPVCNYPHYTARGERIDPGEKVKSGDIGHSWIVSEETTSGTSSTKSYGELSATWTVPPAPIYYNSQIIIFFPGLEDISDPAWILQPVLNWNNQLTEAWSIASWNADQSNYYVSPTVAAYPGDTILGTVKSTCGAGTLSCASWNVTTTDQTTGGSTTLSNTTSHGLTFNWAFGGVLEVYNVDTCYNYPPTQSQSQAFNNVTLYDDDFNVVSNPVWSTGFWANGDTPQCNYNGSGSGTQVTLDYGTTGGAPWSFSMGPPGSECQGDGGSWQFSLNQTPNSNALLWDASLTEYEDETESLNWTLSDSEGTIMSGGTGWYTAPRTPVGTPTLSISGTLLLYYDCYVQFSDNLTGTN
jgi:hypothetical protein